MSKHSNFALFFIFFIWTQSYKTYIILFRYFIVTGQYICNSYSYHKIIQPVFVTNCKTVDLIMVVNCRVYVLCNRYQTKVGVTWRLRNKHQLLLRIASITFFRLFTIQVYLVFLKLHCVEKKNWKKNLNFQCF